MSQQIIAIGRYEVIRNLCLCLWLLRWSSFARRCLFSSTSSLISVPDIELRPSVELLGVRSIFCSNEVTIGFWRGLESELITDYAHNRRPPLKFLNPEVQGNLGCWTYGGA